MGLTGLTGLAHHAVAPGTAGREHQPAGAVLAVVLDLLLLRHPERFAGEVIAVDRLRGQRAGRLIPREAMRVTVKASAAAAGPLPLGPTDQESRERGPKAAPTDRGLAAPRR